jgi:2-keto-4-pentenoate hydratase
MAGIEVVDDRYTDWRSLDTPTLIADDFFHAGVVLGPTGTDWRQLDLAGITGRMFINDEEVGQGRGGDVLGHPFVPLVWLANQLARYGQGLRAGELVMTGSIVATRWVQKGDRVAVVLEGLGTARVDFI